MATTTAGSDGHVLGELGLEHWIDGDLSRGKMAVLPGMLVPGTGLVRIGILTILADVVAGQPPGGPITPTTDINVHVVRPVTASTVHLVSRILKRGATLVVTETLLTADDDPQPFATSLATFMNRGLTLGPAGPPAPPLDRPFAERMGARFLGPGVVELDNEAELANGHHGTIQGGIMATLVELAAESAHEAPLVVTSLDIRFLNRVKVGPAQAVARPLVTTDEEVVVGVTVTDQGDGNRIVSYAWTRCLLHHRLAGSAG
jgi:acyl-coenzyme A thioesterase PaaI-like protein